MYGVIGRTLQLYQLDSNLFREGRGQNQIAEIENLESWDESAPDEN